jgi:hypothetical protein
MQMFPETPARLLLRGNPRSGRTSEPVMPVEFFQFFFGVVLCCSLGSAAYSRSQWEIQHPTLPADQDGTYMPGQLHKGVPSSLSKNFWQGGQYPGQSNIVQPGVVLTGVMEVELSSARSKPGDIFALTLQDGYVQNGMQVIPQNSKIVGTVTSVAPAALQRHGQPGNIQVSLQSLVLPDGTHLPFYGFIANNPNQGSKDPPKKRHLGFELKDAGSSMAGMLSPYTGRMGYLMKKQYRGNDFYIDQGEAVPVRLNQQLVIPDAEVKPVTAVSPNGIPVAPGMNPAAPGMNPAAPGMNPAAPGMNPAIPGMNPAIPGMNPAIPGMNPAIPGMSQAAPGLYRPGTGTQAPAVPGLAGPDSVGQYRTPAPAQPVPGLSGESDPFNLPVNPSKQSKPLSEMPEPF